MLASLILLCALAVVGSACYLHFHLTGSDASDTGDDAVSDETDTDADTDTSAEASADQSGEICCGMHITCEKDSLMAAVSEEIVYYDDEELDTYAGRRPEEYDDREIEQFRDVLLTLLPDDIAGWGRSLQLRGIQLPAPVRDELLMIVAEARAQRI